MQIVVSHHKEDGNDTNEKNSGDKQKEADQFDLDTVIPLHVSPLSILTIITEHKLRLSKKGRSTEKIFLFLDTSSGYTNR
jgi:hypothetical protein